MKKLFLAALLATVAVGGAYAQAYQAQPESVDPSTDKFDCISLTTPTCGSFVGTSGTLYQADTDNAISRAPGSPYDLQYVN